MKNISKFVPALFVAGVLTLTVPFLNRAKAEPVKPKTTQVDTVILEGWRDLIYNQDGSYQYSGLFLFNASSSSNSPKINLPIYTDGGASNKTQLADVISGLSAVGFKTVRYTISDGPYFINTVLLEREN